MDTPRRGERPPHDAPRAHDEHPAHDQPASPHEGPLRATSEDDSLGSLKVTFRVSGWVRLALARLAGTLVNALVGLLTRRPWVLAFLALLLSLLVATLVLLGLQAWTAVRIAEAGTH